MSTDALRPSPRWLRAVLLSGLLLSLAAGLNLAFGSTHATAQDGADAQDGDVGPEGEGAELAEDPELVDRGSGLFGTHCALCHGEQGRGLTVQGPRGGPSLQGVGAASVDFMIRTGRMPMDNAQDRLQRHDQRFSDEDREALVAYVTSIMPGEGPDIPDIEGYEEADLARGLEVFTTNCAACHGPTAQGVAVGQQDVSSTLDVAEPIEIAEAVRSGPGVMPRFLEDTLSQEDLVAVTAWVHDLRDRESPGGWSFGRSGTVSEGFLAVVLGLGLLSIVMYLLGERGRDDPPYEAASTRAEGGDDGHA